jgi:hypothetical protein
MKNIHIIPTDKPSRIALHWLSETYSLFSKEREKFTMPFKNTHMYITNSEEIKDGDWFLTPTNDLRRANIEWIITVSQFIPKTDFKKIILTTDQDLIKDGVQAIDDEFLEWFVKNSSCERVDVENWLRLSESRRYYEIIIPKEEPKQELPKTEIDWSGFPKSTQKQVGFTEPNIIDDWLDKNGNPEIAKQVEEEAEEFCKKQTAVEWLHQEITKKSVNDPSHNVLDIFEQAKEMEKQQIIDACYAGKFMQAREEDITSKEYYNITFQNKY